MDSLVGKTLGAYEVVSEIGRGGMAVVYKAYQRGLDRYVAIKVLLSNLESDHAFVERFEREAQAAAKLKNPNIVTIHDVGQQGTMHYIVMEFLEGVTLTQVMQSEKVLAPGRAATIAGQIATALHYAHGLGFVHRDVKPSNIMLEKEGRAVLTDFGIARALEGTRLTQTGLTMGTPEYMSPEQSQGKPCDGRADLYSLGIMLFEMLTGQVPFRGNTPLVTLYKQIHDQPPDPSKLDPKLPPKLVAVLRKALAKDPTKRFATGQEMVLALQGSVPGMALPTPGAMMPVQPASKRLAAETFETARQVGRRTLFGVGRFSLALVKTIAEALFAAAALLVLIGIILAFVLSFVLAQYSQTTLRDYSWYFQDLGPSKPYVITGSTFDELAAPYVANHTFGAIQNAALAFASPDQLRFSARVLGYPLTLDGRVYQQSGVPQVQLQHLNQMPLPVIDSIISNGINQGFDEGWSKSPVRVVRFTLTDNALTMETDYR